MAVRGRAHDALHDMRQCLRICAHLQTKGQIEICSGLSGLLRPDWNTFADIYNTIYIPIAFSGLVLIFGGG